MEEDIVKFKRMQKIGEIIIFFFVIFLFVIIHLPITPEPNRQIIYVTAFIYAFFVFLWHKIKVPINSTNKNFIESIIGIIAISLVIRATGGITSYFNFLYLLPNLSVSTTSTKWHAVGIWLVTIFFISLEALLFADLQTTGLVALLNIWAVGLVSFYGRSLSQESGSSREMYTKATIEKEKSINKLKDEFVFLISHELRGPITAIRGYLELFLNSGDNTLDQVKNLAKLAFKQSDKLNNLIIQLLDLSRIETGKFKLTNERFDLNNLLKEVIDITQAEAQEKKIKMESKLEKNPTIVFADKERTKEVIANLLDYAIKNTGEFGKIWVWDEVRNGFAYVSVSDSSSGLSAEDLSKIFTRFSGKDSPGLGLNTSKETAGLGLYLCKQLVERMGGQIIARSQLGKGTTFTFNFPLTKTSD